MMIRSYIGDRKFYRRLFTITLPLVIQQLITTLVQLIDNIMVGSLDESAINSVSVVNQLYFVFILITFGVLGGAGIFSAQYYGSKDFEKLRETFRFKVVVGFGVSLLAIITFTLFGRQLFMLFTQTEDTVTNGLNYLAVTKYSLIPLALSIAISTTFREIGITRPLLYISIIAVLTNTILNYGLIFGNFGLPRLEVLGAGIATLIARILEFILTFIFYLKRGTLFKTKFLRLFRIEKKVLIGITAMALPLTLNEAFWSLGQTAFLFSYAQRGDTALAAMYITNAVSQLVFVTFGAVGTGVAVLVGNTLGANELEQAKDNAKKLIAFAVMIATFAGTILFILSYFVLDFYQIDQSTKNIAMFNIRVNAFFIPFFSYNVAMYFVLRSGGDTFSTVLMDSGYMWIIAVPIALTLAYFTALPVTMMFLIIQGLDIPKAFIATTRFKKEKWLRNLAISAEIIKNPE
ncbi:MAG: MATE family efflux transporter [Candidatus Izemoplasmataceae bacterium]|jgi:putative MATE family efflux protein|uniref:MATE family efflux transporter n=1 Tax=Liberiplasma polymorphum TaxID=3374570 RepID=UPI003771CD77